MLLEKDPTQVIWESLKLQTIWSHLGLFFIGTVSINTFIFAEILKVSFLRL